MVKGEICLFASIHIGQSLSISNLLCAKRVGIPRVVCKRKKIIEVFWCPPFPGWVKLNTDGCSLGNLGKAGVGRIFRNERAESILNYREIVDIITNFEAEFLAIMAGLEQAKYHGIQNLWIECDSVTVVTLLSKGLIPEANTVADFLAKSAARLEISSPVALRSILQFVTFLVFASWYVFSVAYKLSKKKTDETFRSLYTILFGRRGKASDVKKNISQFSGFVWHENEEKQRMKLKEKFDKCFKEKLVEFCDVLDISVVKTTTRKEDIVVKLIDFLASPHATNDVLLAEKEQPSKARKRKRSVKGTASKPGGSSAKDSSGKQRKSGDTPKGKDKGSALDTGDESEEEEEEENDNDVPDEPQEVLDHSENEDKNEDKEDESVEESEEDTRKRKRSSKKSSSKKESAGKTNMKKCTTSTKATPTILPKKTPSKTTPSKSSSKSSKVDDSIDKSPKVFSRKKKNEETRKRASTPAKSATKEKAGLKVVKGKDKSREGEPGPSEDELRTAICEILKEVDFNTATFTDILKLLARRFKMDLTQRKSAIKLLIQEELTKLADEAEDNEEDDGEGDEKEDQPTAAQEVEA
ncbi:uncharacterized protein LOC122059152 [Macadamia integrifolia]|uniref:uncharacterized protein LOC122059152 n=1 Tax=Macadamia integrifolia TaxID=60698 RepID=UPI001C52FC0D|nr:uncharacterized protein LOC122059152 [Macadamia integrifolia]